MAQGQLEALVESRVLSAQRTLGWMVLFHAMAARVSAFWPLRFQHWRSQSGLRIATTAAPVSASELEGAVEELAARRLTQGSIFRGFRVRKGASLFLF